MTVTGSRRRPSGERRTEPTKVLCILPFLVDPTMFERITLLQRAGFDVHAIAFENHHFSGPQPPCPLRSLGRLHARRYFFRIPEIMTRLLRMRAAMRRADIVYAFYAEMAMAALAAGIGLAKPMVLEIHDIKRHQVARGPLGRLVRSADRITAERCALLVFTTRNYRSYYRDRLHVGTPVEIMESKVDSACAAALCAQARAPSSDPPRHDGPLRIGYFGLLKDPWSLRVLDRLATASPACKVVLAGAIHPGVGAFHRVLDRNPHLEYRGAFRNPEDLADLYREVDMMMACYRTDIPWCWAQSCRYYQACLFRTPLIVRAGTGDAGPVARHRIGLVIAGDDIEHAAAAIGRVTRADWVRWHANMAALPRSVYAHTDRDVLRLGHAVRTCAGQAPALR